MQQGLDQMRFNRAQFPSAHSFDLLDDVLPIHLIGDPFALGDPAQQYRLPLRPGGVSLS